jgi:hypothetical protein
VGAGVGAGVGEAVGLGVGVGVGVGVAPGPHELVGTARPEVKWISLPYGARTSAAGTWLVVKALSPMPGYSNPPSAPCMDRR